MYYSIYDNQLCRVRDFAMNSKRKTDVRTALVDYLLLGNFSDEGEKSIKANSLEELCDYYEFTLIQSVNPIADDFEL